MKSGKAWKKIILRQEVLVLQVLTLGEDFQESRCTSGRKIMKRQINNALLDKHASYFLKPFQIFIVGWLKFITFHDFKELENS